MKGLYAKSKAEATANVLKAAERGLTAMVVHPSGMIGPENDTKGYMKEMMRTCLKVHIPFSVSGGYDFADVRDAADKTVFF